MRMKKHTSCRFHYNKVRSAAEYNIQMFVLDHSDSSSPNRNVKNTLLCKSMNKNSKQTKDME